MTGPGRGHWDRALSRNGRNASTRAAIIDAVRTASSENGPDTTVGHVVARAGIGRNTFYAHFSDLSAALAAAEDEATSAAEVALARALQSARTPIERLRALAREWLETQAQTAPVAPRGHPWLSRDVGRLERALRDVLAEARLAGVIARAPDTRRIRYLGGAFVAAALDGAGRSSAERDEMAEMLADFALRVFR
jgi:AcrR family transcriptional regulator